MFEQRCPELDRKLLDKRVQYLTSVEPGSQSPAARYPN